MKHCYSISSTQLLLCAIFLVSAVAMLPPELSAQGQSASIRATANVVNPLGITEVSDLEGRYMFAPANSFALVFIENNEFQYTVTLQANEFGLGSLDYLNPKMYSSQPSTDKALLPNSSSLSLAQLIELEPSLVTLILTEN